jgi:transcription elongation factor Elf1
VLNCLYCSGIVLDNVDKKHEDFTVGKGGCTNCGALFQVNVTTLRGPTKQNFKPNTVEQEKVEVPTQFQVEKKVSIPSVLSTTTSTGK